MRHEFSSTSGMTFIELMFAAGILAMTLSMLFGSLVNITAMGSITESRTIAEADVDTVMEEIQTLSNLPLADLVTYQLPDLHSLGPLETITVDLVLGDSNRLALPLTGYPPGITRWTQLPNPLPVQCTVSWYTERRPISLRATRLVYR